MSGHKLKKKKSSATRKPAVQVELPLPPPPGPPLPVEELATGRPVMVPPLIKGYLRSGAKLLGPPAWDPDFGTADLPLLLRLADLPARHRRHFLQA